jgi:hypothetical protein
MELERGGKKIRRGTLNVFSSEDAMRIKRLITAMLLALPIAAAAQTASFVTMIGTNANYANGSMTANFLPPANSSQFDYLKYRFPFTVSAPLNSSGAWSMSLADTSTVLPASSQWRLQLCSPATFGAPTCSTVTMAVTCVNNGSCSGTTLDLSSSFAGAPLPPTGISGHGFFGGSSGTAFTSLVTGYGGGPVLTTNLQALAMTVHLDVTPVGCTQAAQVGLYDMGANPAAPSATLVPGSTLTFANSQQDFTVVFTAALTAGHLYNWGTVRVWTGCTTNGSSPHFNVEFITTR